MSGSPLRLLRCQNAADFLLKAEEFLVEHEVHNCLPIGIASLLRTHPEHSVQPPYFAVVVAASGAAVAAAVMTPPQNLVLAQTGSRDAVTAIAEDVSRFLRRLPGATGPMPVSQWLAEAWQAQTGDSATQSMSERIYKLTQVRLPEGVAGRARRALDEDRGLLMDWLTAFELEAFGRAPADVDWRVDAYFRLPNRGIYLWEVDGQPVSMSGFGGPTPHGIRIGPVFTPPALRGHGYASACVARLSQDQLDGGRSFCCLYTDLLNPTSNHIYQSIGYEPVYDVAEYRFEQPPAAA